MHSPTLTQRDKTHCLIALVAALAVVSVTSSLAWPILAESLRNQGYSETLVGLNAAAQFAGIIAVALAATRIIPRLGFFRTMLIGQALVASMLLLLPATRDYHWWLLLRFVLGVGNSLLFTAGDTWVNQIVDDRVRGRWIGIYSTVGMAGWAVGPIIGSLMDPETYWPFVTGVGTIALAVCLLVPTRRIDIRFGIETGSTSHAGALWLIFLAAPTVLLSSAMFGIVEGGMQSFAHLYTMDVLGDDQRSIAYAVIWVGAVAAIFFQYPIGWLADRVDRGWLLVGCVVVTAVSISLLPALIEYGLQPWWSPQSLLLWASLSIWGGGMGGIFTVGLTLLGERFRGVHLVAANAVFSLLFGIGGLVGPLWVGSAMGYFGPIGFPTSLVVVVAAYGGFAAYRQATRSRRPIT